MRPFHILLRLNIYQFNLHYGFISSFECSNRVNTTIFKLKDCVDVYDQSKSIIVPELWQNMLKNMNILYDNLPYINCIACSFKNDNKNIIQKNTCDFEFKNKS